MSFSNLINVYILTLKEAQLVKNSNYNNVNAHVFLRLSNYEHLLSANLINVHKLYNNVGGIKRDDIYIKPFFILLQLSCGFSVTFALFLLNPVKSDTYLF